MFSRAELPSRALSAGQNKEHQHAASGIPERAQAIRQVWSAPALWRFVRRETNRIRNNGRWLAFGEAALERGCAESQPQQREQSCRNLFFHRSNNFPVWQSCCSAPYTVPRLKRGTK